MYAPTETAIRIMAERGVSVCECCGQAPAEEAHHCLYRRDTKNKAAGKLLNDTYNLQLVCRQCHASRARTHDNKIRFWRLQVGRYGRDVMTAWHEQLPYKIKETCYI